MGNMSFTLEDIMLTGEATLEIFSFMIQVGYTHSIYVITCVSW